MDATTPLPVKAEIPPEGDFLATPVSIAALVEQLSGFLRRQYPIFVFVLMCAFGLGLLYLFTTPPQYTADAMLMIDTSKMRVLQQQPSSALGDIPLDEMQVETQVEVLKSENIALAVIKDMHLTEAPDFTNARGGLLSSAWDLANSFFRSPEPQSEAALTRSILNDFLGQRAISRVNRTYVLDIAFRSQNPGRAAAIANAIADAYIVDQLDAKYQVTRRASGWLQDRIKELRQQASAADLAVLEYKQKNNIVEIGGGNAAGSGARLLGDQQVTELSSQLSAARAAAAEAEAKFERIQDVMQRDVPDAAVADSLHSEVINRLRSQYLDLSAREAIFSARYGKDHLATVNMRTQMAQLRRTINDELGRIAQSYKSDFEIAKARVDTLEKELSGLVSGSQVVNRDRLGLRELESSAHVYNSIYDSFLQRYMEAIQQQSFPITEARVISSASPPQVRSSPNTLVVMSIAASIGILLSFAIATLREAMDRVFRSRRQVEEILRVNCLAVLPVMKNTKAVTADVEGKSKEKREKAEPGRKLISLSKDTKHRFLRYVVNEPLSAYAEVFRTIKVSADINLSIEEKKVIGVTSTVPREGKSTVCCNLAELMAHAGARVVLIDGDLRNPTLTRSLARDAKVGLLEVLGGKVDFRDAVYTDEETNLTLLPVVLETRMAHTNEVLASKAFERLIENLRREYDYVLVDLPPLAPVVDVRATTHVIDSYIYVIEWGTTNINIVQRQMASAPEMYDRLLGVVLNNANVNVLARYEYYDGGYYHKQYYGRYGYGYGNAS